MKHLFAFHTMTFPLGVLAVFSVVAAVILIFELLMLIHVIRNQFIPTNKKAIWIIGMLLLHPFIAIWYYFSDYRRTK